MSFSKLSFGAMGVACALVVGMGARPNPGGLEEIVLDAGFHHLGDGFIPSWVVPAPEGTILEITFSLNQGQIRRAKTAHFEFFLLQNDWSNVRVNGGHWALPRTVGTEGLNILPVTGKTLFSIPTSFLRQGDNSIVFESVQHGNNFDDFEVGDVVLMLNR